MKVAGRFKLTPELKVFEVDDDVQRFRCSNCLNDIKKGEFVYVCELKTSFGHDIYCSCWNKRNTPVCRNILLFNREHQEIYCQLIIKQKEGGNDENKGATN